MRPINVTLPVHCSFGGTNSLLIVFLACHCWMPQDAEPTASLPQQSESYKTKQPKGGPHKQRSGIAAHMWDVSLRAFVSETKDSTTPHTRSATAHTPTPAASFRSMMQRPGCPNHQQSPRACTSVWDYHPCDERRKALRYANLT